MWFGGQSMHDALLRRIVRYGSGFHPFGAPSPRSSSCVRPVYDSQAGAVRTHFAGLQARQDAT